MTEVASAARPRGWYYGWNIVAVCVLSQVSANALTFNSFSLFLRDWSTEFQAPISQLQLSLFAMIVTAAAISPFVGTLAEKYPARMLLACGLLGMAAFYLAIGSAGASWHIVALYGLLAPLPLTLSTTVISNTAISRWFVRHRGLALGMSAFGIGLAGVLLPPLVAVLLPDIGWRGVWRWGALVLALVVMPLVFIIVRERPTEREGLHYITTEGNTAPSPEHGTKGPQITWGGILARKNFWLIVAGYLPLMAAYGAYGQNLAPYVAKHGLSREFAGWLISIFSLSHLIATFVAGPISDRVGNRLPFAGLAVIAAAGVLLLAFGDGSAAITLATVLVGIAGGVHTLQPAALATEFGAGGFSRAYGLSYVFLPLMAIAPIITAKVQEMTGSYAPAFVGMAVIVLGGGALSLLLKENRAGGPVPRMH